MSLTFRIATVIYSFGMMSFALFVQSTGILGLKIKWRLLPVFFICAEVLQWISLGISILMTLIGINEDIASSSLFDIFCYTSTAFILGWLLSRNLRVPLIHAITASILGTFIINTANSLMVQVVEEYSPLFDRQHFLVFIHFYIPYTLTLVVAVLTSFILKKSEFYRYFSALFRSRFRSIFTLFLCYVLMCIMPLLQLIAPETTPDAGYATFFFSLIVIGLFLIQFAAMYAAGQDKIKAQEETILQQQAHMALLEELQQEIRAFRHDFTNLFSGLTLQAQEGDLAGIQDFMKRTSSYFDEKLGNEIAQMDGLNNIELYPLRSLLATKLAKMRQMHVKGVLEALDYIVKGDRNAMTKRAQKCLESIVERMQSQRPGQGNYCTVKILDTVRHIPIDHILYLEAVGYRHTLRLHLDDELLEFNSSLNHFAKQLGETFWRCHRSFLVNRSRIQSVHLKEQTVEMDNGDICLLSRKAKQEYRTD